MVIYCDPAYYEDYIMIRGGSYMRQNTAELCAGSGEEVDVHET